MERTKYTPKRLLSLLLALIMLLGMFPTAALAADGATPQNSSQSLHSVTLKVEIEDPGPVMPNKSVDVAANWSFIADNPNTLELSNISLTIGGRSVPVGNQSQSGGFAAGTEIASGRITNAKGSADINGCLSVLVSASATRDVKDKGPDDSCSWGFTTQLAGVELSHYEISYQGGQNMPAGTTLPATEPWPKNTSYTTKLPTYTSSDYTFGGWQGSDGNKYNVYGQNTNVTNVTGNMTMTGIWDKNFTVEYKPGNYSGVSGVPQAAEKSAGKNYTIPSTYVPYLPGYTFKGWQSSIDEVTYEAGAPLGNVTQDVTLTAQWEPLESADNMTVTFDVGVANAGPVPGTQTVTAGGHATAPGADPVRDDYEFEYWYLSTDATKARYDFDNTPVNDNITLCAMWKNKQVTVTWKDRPTGAMLVYAGGDQTASGYNVMVNKGSTVSFTVKWGVEYEPATVLANGQPLGAVYEGTDSDGSVNYTYTFKADSDTEIEIGTPNRKTFTITLPSANGCDVTFTDCYRGSVKLDNAEGATSYTFEYGDTFKVKLEAYADTRVILRVDGREELRIESTSTGDTQVAPKTSQEGGAEVDKESYVVDHDYVITVNTKPVVTRMVTFSLEPYGSIYSIQYVENGSALTKPAKPEIPGYNFGEKWTTKPNGGGREWKFADDKVTSNMVLYGQLTPMTYAVNYEANAGTDATVRGIPDAQTKIHGEPLTLTPADPTREGYTFKGWATSADGPVAYQPGGASI